MDIAQILVSIVKTVPYLVLFVLPFKGRLYHSPRYTICFGMVSSVVCLTFAMIVLNILGSSVPAKIVISIGSVGLMLYLTRWLIDMSPFSFLFLILMCKNYIDMILLAGIGLQMLLAEENASLYAALASTGIMIITLPFCYLLLKNLLGSVFDCTERLAFWKYLWVLPGFYYIMYRLIVYPSNLYEKMDRSFAVYCLIPFWIAVVLLSYFFLFRVMTETMEGVQLREQLRSAELLAQMQKEQYLTLQNSIEETQRNRHDLKHQFIVIRGYVEQAQCSEVIAYIEQCMALYSCHVEKFCQNYAINSIIGYYVGMARSHQIKTTISVNLPSPLCISEVDFCTLLGNLLMNAVEAGIRKKSGEKTLVLRMASAGENMLALSVSNDYDGEVRIKGGVFYSSKRDSEGIGTASVRQIVKKYQGILKYTYEGGVFTTSILLRLPGCDPKPSGE